MDFERASKLLNASDILEAQDTLRLFSVADFPNLKKEERSRLHKGLHKKAYPHEWSNVAPLTLADASKKLSNLSFPKGKTK